MEYTPPHGLPIDRQKLACLPSQASIKTLPPFQIGDKVYLVGSLSDGSSGTAAMELSSPRLPPQSSLKRLHTQQTCRKPLIVRIVDDRQYLQDGTFSIAVIGNHDRNDGEVDEDNDQDGKIYHGISGLRLEPISPSFVASSLIETPRYINTLVQKMVYIYIHTYIVIYYLCSLRYRLIVMSLYMRRVS
jgi:hypothetical protein